MKRYLQPAYVVPALLVVFLLLITTAAAGKSATYDESVHLFSGWRILTEGDFATNHEHPPLMKVLGALPLVLMDLAPPTTELRREVDKWQAAHEFVFHVNDGDRVLAAARFPIAVLAVVMAWVVYRLAASWFGAAAGMAALALVVFDPNILAHAGIVTTDLGMTAMTVFNLAAFSAWLKEPTRPRLVLSGILFGLALLTKFTAVLLAPMLALVGALYIYLDKKSRPGRWRDLLVGLAVVAGIGLVVLNMGYAFRGTFSSLRDFTPESERFTRMAAGPLGALPLPVPLEYVGGFDHAEAGGQRWWSYLFGEYSMTGWRHYYLAALAAKTTLPLLLLAALGMAFWSRIPRGGGNAVKPADALLSQIPVLVLLFAFTISGNLKNIGLRYILPVYPFLCILGGMATRLRFRGSHLLWGLVVWQAAIGLWMYPDYLTFFNLMVGGPTRGVEVLLDSNLDWGQDLKGLGEFIEEKGINEIYVDYFGRSCMSYYGVKSTPEFQGGWIAVSATQLKGVYDDRRDRYRFLWDREPEAVIGGSIFVYNVERPAGWEGKRQAVED